MSCQYEEKITVTLDDCAEFSALSGDLNPLHIDLEYGAKSAYKGNVLHGAFWATVVSRVAGNSIPGSKCLLSSIQLKFLAPVVVPSELIFRISKVLDLHPNGKVEFEVLDFVSRQKKVTGSYSYSLQVEPCFNRYDVRENMDVEHVVEKTKPDGVINRVLVSGGSGGLGAACLRRMARAEKIDSRQSFEQITSSMAPALGNNRAKIDAIIHCAWPSPDSSSLLDYSDKDLSKAIEYYVSEQLEQVLTLARILDEYGERDSILVLIGSTSALPGTHRWGNPLYSLGKGMLFNLNQILSSELGKRQKQCCLLVFDVLAGGMSSSLGGLQAKVVADRYLDGKIPTIEDAVDQIEWVIRKPGNLANGSCITLNGGARV